MSLRIVLFEDIDSVGNEMLRAIKTQLGSKGEVCLFKSTQPSTAKGTYEKRLEKDLGISEYQNPALIVADRDLSLTKEYPGMSESVVKHVADKLGIPESAYSRGEQADDFLRSAEQREARVALSLACGEEKFAEQVVSIAEGFAVIADKLRNALKETGRKSPGKLLASILGKPEYADKIALYASGDQNRLASVPQLRGIGKEESIKHITCLLGYWLWDSVLRYPGVVVNEVAASSYVNIEEAEFKENPKIQTIFAAGRYEGPFAGAIGPMWWRGVLDDIVAESGFADGRELAENNLKKTIRRSECCEDPTKPAGYYCMLSKKPVSLENSKGGLTWFPRGADLARVSSHQYDELAPWL